MNPTIFPTIIQSHWASDNFFATASPVTLRNFSLTIPKLLPFRRFGINAKATTSITTQLTGSYIFSLAGLIVMEIPFFIALAVTSVSLYTKVALGSGSALIGLPVSIYAGNVNLSVSLGGAKIAVTADTLNVIFDQAAANFTGANFMAGCFCLSDNANTS